jgi:hypothetical protein
VILHKKDHSRKENMTKESEQMFRIKNPMNHMALNLIRNALFTVGIHGTKFLIILKARVINQETLMAIALIL